MGNNQKSKDNLPPRYSYEEIKDKSLHLNRIFKYFFAYLGKTNR